MKTTDFNTAITSKKLKENMNKMFGINVNLDKYDREQLEDMRNKLRTRMFQQEGSAGVNDLLTNETYQKDKAMLDLLNTRIKEMLGENIAKLRDKLDELNESKKGVRQVKHPRGSKGADQNKDGKHDFDDVQIARMTAGGVPKKKAIAKATSDNFKEAAEKTPSTWTDKSGKQHPATKVKGDKYTGKEAEKEAKSKATKEAAEKTPSTWTDKSGKTHPATKVKGDKYTGKEAEKEAKSKIKGNKHTVKESAMDDSLEKILARHARAVDHFKQGGDLDYDLESDLWDYYFNSGDILNYNADASEWISQKLADELGLDEGSANAIHTYPSKRLKESISKFKHNVKFVNESLAFLLSEDEEGKAKAITAASDMVNDFTTWMQRVGQYQTKAMIELADQIRADFGQQEAETFKQSVAPALATTLETLTTQREVISNAVAVLAGEAAPMEPMGMEPGADMDAEPGMDVASPDEMNPPTDDFGASDAAAGDGTAGRGLRESKKEEFARKLAESHSIMSKLAK